MKPRHVPMRTCAGCRQTRAKRELVRVVRAPDGSVGVDVSGKRSGRGTYVCSQAECWKSALRTGSLARVLRVNIREPDLAELRRFAASLEPRSTGSGGVADPSRALPAPGDS